VSANPAEKATDRVRVMLTRDQLVEATFPTAVRRADWASQPDPVIAEGVWNTLDTFCWTLCDIKPSGAVQQLLNGQTEDPQILVRMKPTRPGQPWGVYTTRNLNCLTTDVVLPMQKAEERRAKADARLVEMLMRRVPEHAPKFSESLKRGLKNAHDTGKKHTDDVLLTLTDGS